MTFSGRRVKRRNLDECDGNSLRSNRSRKSRSGQKVSRKKSSKSKSLRPQRAAARNALTLFSRMKGTSTDGEDEDGSEGDPLETESSPEDSDIESYESDGSLQNEQGKHSKGKEVSFDESELIGKRPEHPESHINAGNRRRLVLKFPIRDANRLLAPEKQVDFVGSSSKAPQEASELNRNGLNSHNMVYTSSDANCNEFERRERVQPEKIEDHLDLFDGYKDGKIKWGGVKARTSKRLRVVEPMPSVSYTTHRQCVDGHDIVVNTVNGFQEPEKNYDRISPHSEIKDHVEEAGEIAHMDGQHFGNGAVDALNATSNTKEHSNFSERMNYDEQPKPVNMVSGDMITSSVQHSNGIDHIPDLQGNSVPSTKFRIRSKRILEDPEISSSPKIKSSVEEWSNGQCDTLSESQFEGTEIPHCDDTDGPHLDHGDWNGLLKSEPAHEENSGSVLQDSRGLHSHVNNKMYNAVYRRSRSYRTRTNSEGEGGGMEESTSNASNHNLDLGVDLHEAIIDGARRTRSMGLKTTTQDPDVGCSNLKLRIGRGMEDTKVSINRSDELPSEEWVSSSRMTVGLRSARNRRASYHVRDTSPSPMERRKPHHSSKKVSWLMLSMHVEPRYIPQLGDEVVYLRQVNRNSMVYLLLILISSFWDFTHGCIIFQGHQEYINYSGSHEQGPWISIKGIIRAVEFCKVESLEYSSFAGSGDCCCKMMLQFVDPTSHVFGKTFKLTLPEVTSFPDFLVERTRYDAAILRNWTSRDKCRVWWKNEGEEDGSWWDGRILSVKARSPEFPDSPWDRYVIRYRSEPTETHLHSPWELYDIGTQWGQPHIDDESRNKLLSLLAKLEQSGDKPQVIKSSDII